MANCDEKFNDLSEFMFVAPTMDLNSTVAQTCKIKGF
jgi:hypothetical protein